MRSNRETIIVTGSSGLIGYPLCERLAENFNVIGLDRPGVPHPPPQAERIDVDLASDESVAQAFKLIRTNHGIKIASVIHLAAYYDFSGKPSDKYETITVQGTERLLQALKAFEVEQFIFSSTMLVHAPTKPGKPINEDWPINPTWDYPKSKVKTENLIRRERKKMPAVLLRIAGVYDDGGHSIPISHQIQRIFERTMTSRVFPGDLSAGQAFLHLDDLIHLFSSLISIRKQLPQEWAALAGEEKTVGYGRLQNEIGLLIHGTEWKTSTVPKWFAKIGAWLQDAVPFFGDPFIKPWMIDRADDHYELNISRIRKATGWEPQHSLLNTLPAIVSALKQDPLHWYQENHLTPPSWLKKQSHLLSTNP